MGVAKTPRDLLQTFQVPEDTPHNQTSRAMENLTTHSAEILENEDCISFPTEMLTPVSKKMLSSQEAFRENVRSGEQNEKVQRYYGKRKFGKSLSFDDSRTSDVDIVPESKKQHISNSSAQRIMNTVEEMSHNESLIGDGTKAHSLPIVSGGKHKDLKYISHETVTSLMENQYTDMITDYVIIDCRYPYEYNGGHIKDAVNLHTQDMVDGFFLKGQRNSLHKNTVLVFHCEFSSERAPKLLRYLRNKDRELNAENYPSLCYPEIYLLRGGYKEFFENQKNHCLPKSYVPMLNKEYSADLRHFRSKSKSWNGFERRKCIRF